MKYKIDAIEGIGPVFREKLMGGGIRSTEDFLISCCDKVGRKNLSEKLGIGDSQLLKWANMADLMRINGIGKQFAELLEASGVDTVKELRNRKAGNLAAKMKEVNTQKKLCRVSPSASKIQGWIDQAHGMQHLITY